MLYSDQALDMVGVSDEQMESMVFAAFATVNTGFTNSEIGIDLTIVHQTRVSTCISGYDAGAFACLVDLLDSWISHEETGTKGH